MDYRRKHNKRKTNIILVLVILVLMVILFTYVFKKPTYLDHMGIIINDNDYFLEIAQTNKERKVGLSKRTELCSNCGMLFIFNKEDKHSFWMKDTYLPLDIIWLNSKNQIVKIIAAASPDSETTYTNIDPAKYVIELKANEVLKLDLKVGDTIPLELKPNESSN